MDQVEAFVLSLYAQAPDSILLSGGAEGVDKTAEYAWRVLGGTVWSYRIKKKGEDCYVVEKWELGPSPRVYELLADEEGRKHPSFADPTSALFYRSWVVAETCTRLVAFYGNLHQRGTEFTVSMAEAFGKPTFIFRREDVTQS